MGSFYLFTDSSFDSKSQRGVGALLILDSLTVETTDSNSKLEIQTKLFEGENIARLEFLIALEGLRQWKASLSRTFNPDPLTLVTDCMAIQNLLRRRKRLEENHFRSAQQSKLLANEDLYQAFLSLFDELLPKILWVKGHSPRSSQTKLQYIFSKVDRTARQQLRELRQ